MIDVFDKIEMLRDLADGETQCDLVHGRGYSKEDTIAVDYLILPMGMVKEEKVTDYLTFAVCKYCAESILDDSWVLLICKDCGSTRWVWRRYSRLDYINKETGKPYAIVIFEGCPSCTGKMEGVYYYTHEQFMVNV